MAGNWKMHKTAREGAVFVEQLTAGWATPERSRCVVAPAFTGLQAAVDAAGTGVCGWRPRTSLGGAGAYTGEVSPSMLADLCVKYVIIGHSERRQIFGETDEVARKVRGGDHGLPVILCVGETEHEREEGRTEQVLERQVTNGLGASPEEVAEWSSPTNRYGPSAPGARPRRRLPRTRSLSSENAWLIRGAAAAQATRILYGGSVKPDNVADIMAQPDIEGASWAGPVWPWSPSTPSSKPRGDGRAARGADRPGRLGIR